MKSLLIICQKVDESDDLLGFFVSWIREFSTHFDTVTVITIAKGEYSLPSNVRVLSLGKEQRVPKWRQALRFQEYLWREVRRHDAVFAHMSPLFAIAAWPWTFMWHKKLVLWYLHRSRTLKLSLALALVDALVTADARSLTVSNPKIIAVGHGIDVSRFAVPDRTSPEGRALRILSVGRISPIKGFETLIRAAAILRERNRVVDVRIAGRPVMSADFSYERELRELVKHLGVNAVVHFIGFVPYRDMSPQYRWADIVVGCTPPGGIDKVLLEGMAAGCVALTSNDVMADSLGDRPYRFIFPHGDAALLADRIALSGDWTILQKQMIHEVRAHHNVHQAAARISEIIMRSRAS